MRTKSFQLAGVCAVALLCGTSFAASPASATAHAVSARPAASPPSAHSERVCGDTAPGLFHCDARVTVVAGNGPATALQPGSLPAGGYGPADFHTAYGLPYNTTRAKRTIAVVTAFDNPHALADLNHYNAQFGLPSFPTCTATVTTQCLMKVNQLGHASPLPSVDPNWAVETSLDVQTTHEICNNCKIILVEANSNSGSNLAAAENMAAHLGANVISNSWGGPEFNGETLPALASPYNHPGIPITFSSGDDGYQVQFPATLNTVVAVGGTTLQLNANKTWHSESDWGHPDGSRSTGWAGAGSGCSKYVAVRAPQNTVGNWPKTHCGTKRAVADVSADADPETGAYIYDSTPYQGISGWWIVGGTSLASPLIAGVFALGGNPQNVPYPSSLVYAHKTALHDPTGGVNGACAYPIMCHAMIGYDGPTGFGSPKGIAAF